MARFGMGRDAGTPGGQRADCPHTPHPYSCGPVHEGPCALVHQGRRCETVHPICPACRTPALRVHVPSILNRMRRENVSALTLGCSACGRAEFHYTLDMFCEQCEWLKPHVNER